MSVVIGLDKNDGLRRVLLVTKGTLFNIATTVGISLGELVGHRVVGSFSLCKLPCCAVLVLFFSGTSLGWRRR